MGSTGRWIFAGVLAAACAWPGGGCSQPVGVEPPLVAPAVPAGQRSLVRVRILENRPSVRLTATAPPVVRVAAEPARRLNFPTGSAVEIKLDPATGTWRVGDVALGAGTLRLEPAGDGTARLDGAAHRGAYRLVPLLDPAHPGRPPARFDVVNDVDVDGYLKGVLTSELPPDWLDETYAAQAIVARTYALYEAAVPKVRTDPTHFDLYADQRSQVYGGMKAETDRARRAVDATAGVVVAYGDPGREKVFKAYFSSCCGGVTQAAVDAFGPDGASIPPLFDQDVGATCAASPRYNWGPVVVRKDELTRRFRLFGARRVADRPGEARMATVTRIDVHRWNRFGRPTRFLVTDTAGTKYSWNGEELRWAVNTDAKGQGVLLSSYFKLINDADSVRFVEGHGFGHGVGMCQWCAQSRARAGMRHEDIVLAAYQRARLVRAY